MGLRHAHGERGGPADADLRQPGNFDSPDPTFCNGNTFGPVDAAGTAAALNFIPNTCTTDSCNSITGCVHTPVADGSSCEDGVFCDGSEYVQSRALRRPQRRSVPRHAVQHLPGSGAELLRSAGGSGVGVRVGYLRGRARRGRWIPTSAPWTASSGQDDDDLRLADGAGPFAVGTGNDYGFLFVEGGDSTATEFSAFLAAHGIAIATWVNAAAAR